MSTASLAEMYAMFPPLDERRGKAADTLSGGERQMLAVDSLDELLAATEAAVR